MNKTICFLGLDLGEKTLGIAISRFGILSTNLKTIIFNKNQYHELIPFLKEIIEKFNVKKIVLGYPKHMNNDIGVKANISLDFKKRINKNFPYLDVILWDERLSTKNALEILKNMNCKKKNVNKLKDEIAAMVILQSFLNYYNNKKLNLN
ncbi:Holliday junction resolvase RuvX [Candidatus Phytoplasma palmae]|uniref:Holliday junction resolvase RuvX n=1 Tax=Candidatus Phytoplasma palmae TaxID=85624 RepID=UPI00399065AE